jgi:hypothetical protein
MEPVVVPITDVLDLHTFRPREVPDLLDDYLTACVEKGILDVRIVHGKGRGILRERVRYILERHRLVVHFETAPAGAGGWGATRVRLRPAMGEDGAAAPDRLRQAAAEGLTDRAQTAPAVLQGRGSMSDAKESSSGGLDWENRRLCPDESCIGVIGSDGRCTECGRPAQDAAPDPAGAAEKGPGRSADSEADSVQGLEAASPEDAGPPSKNAAEAYWRARRLCPDGRCIGVIGPDGCCKECGRRADAEDPAEAPQAES